MELGLRALSAQTTSKKIAPNDVPREPSQSGSTMENIDTTGYHQHLVAFGEAFDDTQAILSQDPIPLMALKKAVENEETAFMVLEYKAAGDVGVSSNGIDWLKVLDPSTVKLAALIAMLEKIHGMQGDAFDWQALIVATPGEDNNVKVDFGLLREKLQQLIDKYGSGGTHEVLHKSEKTGAAGKKEAEDLAEELRLPAGSVKQDVNGNWIVVADLTAFNKVMEQVNIYDEKQGDGYLTQAQYNGFMTVVDSQFKAIETSVKKATELVSYSRQDRDEIGRQISSLIAKDLDNVLSITKSL